MESKINILPVEHLTKLDELEKVFNAECAESIKWIYSLQQWKPEQLEARIPKVKSSVWKGYGQKGYKNNRSLHVLAALSWLSQVTMSALYLGSNIEQFWQGVSRNVIETIVYSGLLTPSQFYYLVLQMREKNTSQGFKVANIDDRLDRANRYIDTEFLMPQVLDLDEFKKDYYRSVAISLRKFRLENNLSIDTMAHVLNITPNRCRSFEDPTYPVSIPLYVAMRLRLGFQLNGTLMKDESENCHRSTGIACEIKDTVSFIENMEVFPGFVIAREIQQLREEIIIDLLSPIDMVSQYSRRNFARNVMAFHKS